MQLRQEISSKGDALSECQLKVQTVEAELANEGKKFETERQHFMQSQAKLADEREKLSKECDSVTDRLQAALEVDPLLIISRLLCWSFTSYCSACWNDHRIATHV